MEEQQSRETEIRLQDLWTILKHCWWQLLIVLAVVTVVLYIGMNFTHQDEYTATTSIYVMTVPNEDADKSIDTTSISIAQNLINDCQVLMRSRDQVLRPVMVSQNLEGLIEIEELEGMFSVSRSDTARVLYLSITSSSAQRSTEIVNALGEQVCTYFNGLYDQKLLSVVDHATVPEEPSNPISLVTILLIAFVCAVLVYGIHFLKFILDDKINNADDVEKYLGLSMLGVIPNRHDSSRKKSKYGYYYSYTADGEKQRQ